jgi:CheY-like chemotaxis protein
MSDGSDSTPQPNASPREALERAEQALQTLEQSQAADQRATVATRVAVFAVVVLAWAGLIVHTFFEDSAPRVDSTSVALLAVALIAPFVSRLKALEVGGAKAEWQEGAAVSLKEIVQLAGMQQAALQQLFDEMTKREAAGGEAETIISARETSVEQPAALPRPLRRLLWVDDHPENNTYELESLRQILHVITAGTNERAFAVLEAGDDIDAVISDIGRDYDRPGELPGGVQLLGDLRERFPNRRLPVLYYTTNRAIERYGLELERDGAMAVTTSFRDILRTLRQIEEQSLETIARAVASERGRLLAINTTEEPDVVVELEPGRLVGIDVASWLQPPDTATFADRLNRLRRVVDRADIPHGVLLVRPEVLTDHRRQLAADQQIELAAPTEFAQVLDALA